MSSTAIVLEGIGIIEKKSKNNIKWRQDIESDVSSEQELSALRSEHAAIKREEAHIDAQIASMQERLRELASGEQSAPYAYVTHNDIKSIPELRGDTLIAIKAPPGTELEVPDPEEGMPFGEQRYQIFLKSTGGPIDCLLVSQGGEEDTAGAGASVLQGARSLDEARQTTSAAPLSVSAGSPSRGGEGGLQEDSDLMSVLRLSPEPGGDEFYFGLEESPEDGTGIADLYDEVIQVPEEAGSTEAMPSTQDTGETADGSLPTGSC